MMATSTTCGICGTVNVLATGRCIACGQPVEHPSDTATGRPEHDDSATVETGPDAEAAHDPPPAPRAPSQAPQVAGDRTEPVPEPVPPSPARSRPAAASATQTATGVEPAPRSEEPPAPPRPAPAPPSPPAIPARAAAPRPPAPRPPAPAAAPAPPAPPPPAPPTPSAPPAPAAAPAPPPAPATRAPVSQPSVSQQASAASRNDDIADSEAQRTMVASPAEAPRGSSDDTTFVVRLLLPEGDKRLVEIGTSPVRLGSGLDEVGLTGDPRARPGEGTLFADGGRLWVDVEPGAASIYIRIEGEETLEEGDVVLMGDVAAEFRGIPAAEPVDAERQVLGGATASACGRLVFLRRDGSPGPVHDLPAGKTIVGRTDGHMNFPHDSRLSRRHVRFHASETSVTVEDLDSRNGTYLRVRRRRRLDVGDALRVGSAGVQIRGRG